MTTGDVAAYICLPIIFGFIGGLVGACLLWRGEASAPRQYEYAEASSYQAADLMRKNGWELVSVVAVQDEVRAGRSRYFLKRPI